MSWLAGSGQLIEALALIGSLCFTAAALRADVKTRRAENLIRITENHRTIWLHFQDHPDLSRVLEPTPDLLASPVSPKEHRFVILLITHVFTAFKTTQAGLYPDLEWQDEDVGCLFRLPISRAVWLNVRHLQDRDFVRYIETCVGPVSIT